MSVVARSEVTAGFLVVRHPRVDHVRVTSFDERAAEWDTPERRERAEAVAAAIRGNVPLTRTMRTVEIGAGTGLLGLALTGDVGELVLTDPSAGMLAAARRKLAGGPANVSAVRFDLLSDTWTGGTFDLAISLLVLHHLKDTAASLTAIHSLLNPGGILALVDLDAEDGSFHSDMEGIHHQGFEREAVAGKARDAGFTDVSVTDAPDLDRDGRTYPLFLLTARRP